MLVITGQTATGKTKLAVKLASFLNGEIISADSRQVYRNMDIGTGKDLSDFVLDDVSIPYHLIDICDPGEEYNIFRYKTDFKSVYEDILSRNKLPVLCGGSGLYIETVLGDYQLQNVPLNETLRSDLENKSDNELIEMLRSYKDLHNTTDTTSRKRIIRAIEIAEFSKDNALEEPNPLKDYSIFAIKFERKQLKKRITDRLRTRLKEGMVEEAEGLLRSGITKDKLIYYGLEYKYLAEYLDGEYSYNDMYQKLNSAIHRFSKRQMTWFRKMERNGFEINWIDGNLSMDDKVQLVLDTIKK